VLPEESRGAEVLAFIGANPLVVAWARRRPQGLDGQWESCPRADWLLDIAHRAGVPLAQLARAARALPLQLTGSWTEADAMIEDVTAALDQEVDGDPQLIEMQRTTNAAFAAGPRAPIPDLAYQKLAESEGRHRELHERYASALRDAVPYREVRDALYGRTGGPYR
jgi:hypothetical protein